MFTLTFIPFRCVESVGFISAVVGIFDESRLGKQNLHFKKYNFSLVKLSNTENEREILTQSYGPIQKELA